MSCSSQEGSPQCFCSQHHRLRAPEHGCACDRAGEIIPQAVCSRYGLVIGAASSWLVRGLMLVCAPIAWPLSKLLDLTLGRDKTVRCGIKKYNKQPCENKNKIDFKSNGACLVTANFKFCVPTFQCCRKFPDTADVVILLEMIGAVSAGTVQTGAAEGIRGHPFRRGRHGRRLPDGGRGRSNPWRTGSDTQNGAPCAHAAGQGELR